MTVMSGVFVDGTWSSKPVTGVERLSQLLLRDLEREGVLCRKVMSSRGWLWGQLVTLPITRLRHRGDDFIFPFLPPSPFVYLRGRGRNIVFVHDLIPLERSATAGRYTRWIGSQFLRCALRNADIILVGTEKLASELSDRGRASHVWRPEIPNDLHLRHFEGHRDRYILAIGTVEPRKNIPLLVAIARALKSLGSPVKVRLVGKHGWGAPPPTSSPNFEYLGYVDRSALTSLIERASLFISTSSYEGIGLPILEVGHAGLPSAVFRSAIPDEVLPIPAISLGGDVSFDALRIHEFVHDDLRVRVHREAAFQNTLRWNRAAEASRRELLSLMRASGART